MVLCDDMVQVCDLTDRDRGAVRLIVGPDGRRMGLAPIGGVLVPLCCEEKVHRLPILLHGAIEVGPLTICRTFRL
jgi:hypothetical protein